MSTPEGFPRSKDCHVTCTVSMPFAPVGNLRLRYTLCGQGEPVLLVMGLAMSGRGWRGQVEDLSKDFTVCSYDNRGVGDSSTPIGLYTTRALAKDAFGLMDHLGWDRAHVVGISMGGMIAQHMGLLRPERVRSMALISTHMGGLAGRPSFQGTKAFVGMQTTTGEQRLRNVGKMLFSDGFAKDNKAYLRSDFAEIGGQDCSPWGIAGQLAAVLSHMSRRRMHKLRGIPTVVMTGTRDILVRPSNSRRLAEALHAPLVEVEGAGHGLIIEAGGEVNATLREHFARA